MFSSKNGRENRNKAQKLIKLAATEMKAFWCNLLKGKYCEINSNQKLIKVDAIGTVKEYLIMFIELKKYGCLKKDTFRIQVITRKGYKSFTSTLYKENLKDILFGGILILFNDHVSMWY